MCYVVVKFFYLNDDFHFSYSLWFIFQKQKRTVRLFKRKGSINTVFCVVLAKHFHHLILSIFVCYDIDLCKLNIE